MLLAYVLFSFYLQIVLTIQNVKVDTPPGKILGSVLTTRLGKSIYSFRGIRYAKAPINELRFKPPVPVEKWSGVYNATVDGPACPQPSDDPVELPVSEDCLVLNVYSTKLPINGTNPKRSVIVFIHAGGYYSFSARSNWIGPQLLMDQDLVLVTFNYRLGILGFLSLGNKEAPGNNALKDQVVALKWVKNNIASFGGDPDSVTLYGYSAGSWSISLHLVSPMSRGLFHKAIMGSGSALGPYPIYNNQIDLAKKQARFVGCPDTNPRVILDCLKTRSAEELGNSLPKFWVFGEDPIIIFYPVIEENYGQERFLTHHPLKLIEKGNFVKVPIMTGVTKFEFAHVAYSIVENSTILNEVSKNFEKYAPIVFGYERNTPKSRRVSAALRKFYLGDGPLTNSSLPGLKKLYADSVTGFPTHRGANVLSEKSSKPIYYHEFTYKGRLSHFTFPESNQTLGAVHHDDLIYLFYLFYLTPPFPYFNQSDPDSKMIETMTSLWANFAKTGKPIRQSPEIDSIEWKTYNTNTKKYMEIGEKLVLRANQYEERYAIWRKLFPLKNTYIN